MSIFMKDYGSRAPETQTFYSHENQQVEHSDHRFIKEAKTLVAKIRGVSGVKDIVSLPIWKSSGRKPYVAAVQEKGEDFIIVRYFASGICQDMKVECDSSSIGRVETAVVRYAGEFVAARTRRREKMLQND